jgi:aryl-alcohol dehydrogenase-like predicted oxidoreductase
MEHRALGQSGLQVSAVGLGCSNFGRKCDYEQSKAVVRAALDAGITFFDTANVYGRGRSEEFLGNALKGLRDEVVIATKFGVHHGRDSEPLWIRATPGDIRTAADEALRRLGTDYIDLFQLHWPDPSRPVDEVLETLDGLVRLGKVRFVGHSNFAGWQVVEAHYRATMHGWTPFISSQSHYNLLHRDIEREVVPACEAYGVGLLPYYPLASGFLTGKYARGIPPPAGTRLGASERAAQQVMSAKNWAILERLNALAAELGRSMTELAMAWLAGQPYVTSVIAGATGTGQVRANVAACTARLSGDEMDAVDRLSRPPR